MMIFFSALSFLQISGCSIIRYDTTVEQDFWKDLDYFKRLNKQTYCNFVMKIRNKVSKLVSTNDLNEISFKKDLIGIIDSINLEKYKENIKQNIILFITKHLSIYPINILVEPEYLYVIKEYLKVVDYLKKFSDYFSSFDFLTLNEMKEKLKLYFKTETLFKCEFYGFFFEIKNFFQNQRTYIEKGKQIEFCHYSYGCMFMDYSLIFNDLKMKIKKMFDMNIPIYFADCLTIFNITRLFYFTYRFEVKNKSTGFFKTLELNFEFDGKNEQPNQINLLSFQNECTKFINSLNIRQNNYCVYQKMYLRFNKLHEYYLNSIFSRISKVNANLLNSFYSAHQKMKSRIDILASEMVNTISETNFSYKKQGFILNLKDCIDTFMIYYNENLAKYEEDFWFIFSCFERNPLNYFISAKPNMNLEDICEESKKEYINDLKDDIKKTAEYYRCFGELLIIVEKKFLAQQNRKELINKKMNDLKICKTKTSNKLLYERIDLTFLYNLNDFELISEYENQLQLYSKYNSAEFIMFLERILNLIQDQYLKNQITYFYNDIKRSFLKIQNLFNKKIYKQNMLASSVSNQNNLYTSGSDEKNNMTMNENDGLENRRDCFNDTKCVDIYEKTVNETMDVKLFLSSEEIEDAFKTLNHELPNDFNISQYATHKNCEKEKVTIKNEDCFKNNNFHTDSEDKEHPLKKVRLV